VPLQNPDFGPYMQRVRDAKPDALFMWFPSGELANGLLRAYRARGLEAAGIRPLGTSDLVDDMFVDAMGDAAIGLITSAHYSVAHDSPKNKAFLALHRQLYGDKHRPNFMAVAGYDGMALIHDVVKQLGGKIDGDKAMAIIKGAKLDSPRGPITIDPVERDVIQNMYIRKTERRNGELYNIEFATLPDMKDPGKDIAN
jgi:branched-chain amino acid transport system substrate-binding protein